jgi:CubicO group peptidase (beta-lactamase class C family)
MKKNLIALLILFLIFSPSFADPVPEESPAFNPNRIDVLMKYAVGENNISGAVVLVGHNGKVVFEKAYGRKNFDVESAPMTTDTIFDVASLTKVVATTPALMWLVEHKKLKLDDMLARILPAAGKGTHRNITIRQLMTHYSGLPAEYRPVRRKGSKKRNLVSGSLLYNIFTVPNEIPSGRGFIYSDLGYIILGKVIEQKSGLSLDRFVSQKIFSPLKMRNSMFRPDKSVKGRIAPSEKEGNGAVVCGCVQDPTACKLNGVAGNAGLFSTAQDLSRFAQMILNNGTLDGRRILNPETVRLMISPQSPPNKADVRGLGWDIQSRYSSPKGDYFSNGSFGHTGYTGSSLWIDPETNTYVIILSNRENLMDNRAIIELRQNISNIVGSTYSSHIIEKGN